MDQLIGASKFDIMQCDYFRYDEGWFACRQDDMKNISYHDNNAPAAAGLVCILLKNIADSSRKV
jgi:O-antigen chain-terminating methyltransferase